MLKEVSWPCYYTLPPTHSWDVQPTQSIPLTLLHSYLSATNGSIFVARRAGKKHARMATTANKIGATINVIGSSAFTPNSNGVLPGPTSDREAPTTRVRANAPNKPSDIPVRTSKEDRRRTNHMTSRRKAPNAIRTPISRVRWTTPHEMTP